MTQKGSSDFSPAENVALGHHERYIAWKERPWLLDLYCGAGGAATGYHRAGFNIVGVDKQPQPRYPFTFIRADAIEALAEVVECGSLWDGSSHHMFDAIHASPPCQRFSALSNATGMAENHPDLIAPTRGLLMGTGVPWVIENVPRAPLVNPVTICGASLGLRIIRHRLFESSVLLLAPACAHSQGDVSSGRLIGHRDGGKVLPGRVRPPLFSSAEKRAAMGVEWMTAREAREAIPPAYTELIGAQVLAHVRQEVAA